MKLVLIAVVLVVIGVGVWLNFALPDIRQRVTVGELRFLPPIPKGHQISYSGTVAGVSFRKKEAISFFNGKHQSVVLEREEGNEHDSNAIKIIGITESERYFLGYVGKEEAERIVQSGLFEQVLPRLRRVYISETGYIEIQYQITCPKPLKDRLVSYAESKPADKTQKKYLSYFKIEFDKEISKGEAKTLINKHRDSVNPLDLREWEAYLSIIEEFSDKHFRENYEIKAVPKKILETSLEELRSQGMSYVSIYEDIETLAEKIYAENSSLRRKL